MARETRIAMNIYPVVGLIFIVVTATVYALMHGAPIGDTVVSAGVVGAVLFALLRSA